MGSALRPRSAKGFTSSCCFPTRRKDLIRCAVAIMNSSDLDTINKEQKSLNPLLVGVLGAGFLLNIGLMASLPPVLMGKGAPYLPTKASNMDAMFRQVRQSPHFQKILRERNRREFCDLGSGDGRLVFRASREKEMFSHSVGYEINPFLHALAQTQRLFGWRSYWHSTSFFLKDIWKADLRSTDVVAVYGLGPIMNELGHKLRSELRPGSLVLSNVFKFPGWMPENTSDRNTFLYVIPHRSESVSEESG